MAEQKQYRRWYDKDPILREALELLKLQTISISQNELFEDIEIRKYDVGKSDNE